jgi:hypothetical protein
MINLKTIIRFFKIKKIDIKDIYENEMMRNSFIVEFKNNYDMQKANKLLNSKKIAADIANDTTLSVRLKSYTQEQMLEDIENELKNSEKMIDNIVKQSQLIEVRDYGGNQLDKNYLELKKKNKIKEN